MSKDIPNQKTKQNTIYVFLNNFPILNIFFGQQFRYIC